MSTLLTPDQISNVELATTIVNCFSLTGSIFIISCFFLLKLTPEKVSTFRLICILSACDAMKQIFDLIPVPAESIEAMEAGGSITPACYTTAAGDTFFELASVLWTSAIAARLLIAVTLSPERGDSRRALLWFCAVCFGLPLVVTIAPAIDSAYGPAGGWCWLTEKKVYWRFICFYAPLWMCMIFNVAAYVWVWLRIRATIRLQPEASYVKRMKELMARLWMYPYVECALKRIEF